MITLEADTFKPAPRFRMGRGALAWSGLLISASILLLVVLWALEPGWFTHNDPLSGVPADRLTAPGTKYWFGTDELGRDLFTRVVYGTASSLESACIAVALGFSVGTSLGLVSGFMGGHVDNLIMRLVDVLLAVPGVLLSLAIITILGFGTVHVAIAVGVVSIGGFARVMRAEVIRTKTNTFVEAASVIGVRRSGIIYRYILPHSIGSVISLATLELGTAVLSVAALSYLGFGATPPKPEWGSLVSAGRNYMAVAWWMTALPGGVIAITVLAANRLARALDHRA